jgi:hypothetical protein
MRLIQTICCGAAGRRPGYQADLDRRGGVFPKQFRGRLMVKLKGRPELLVVSRNYVDLFKQM